VKIWLDRHVGRNAMINERVPLTKLCQNINNQKGEFVILLSTGAYCPIHRMHVHMMEVANDHIEKKFKLKSYWWVFITIR